MISLGLYLSTSWQYVVVFFCQYNMLIRSDITEQIEQRQASPLDKQSATIYWI